MRGKEMKTIINDAEQVEFLCPGCDFELLPPSDAAVFYGLTENGGCKCGGFGCGVCCDKGTYFEDGEE